MNLLRRFHTDESGATAIEYGLMVALIAAVIVSAVTLIGTNMAGTFNHVSNTLK